MASRICWLCAQSAHQTPHGEAYYARTAGAYGMFFTCDECGIGTIGYGTSTSQVQAKVDLPRAATLDWHPKRYAGRVYADVPEHVASAASEAHTCFSAQAYRAAILVARAVVEATAKDKGIVKGQLASKIDELHKQGHVRELVRDTAHEIRFLGNDMAHGDFVEDISATEAEDVLEFMAEVLQEVYQAPARMNARRDERLARRGSPSGG